MSYCLCTTTARAEFLVNYEKAGHASTGLPVRSLSYLISHYWGRFSSIRKRRPILLLNLDSNIECLKLVFKFYWSSFKGKQLQQINGSQTPKTGMVCYTWQKLTWPRNVGHVERRNCFAGCCYGDGWRRRRGKKSVYSFTCLCGAIHGDGGGPCGGWWWWWWLTLGYQGMWGPSARNYVGPGSGASLVSFGSIRVAQTINGPFRALSLSHPYTLLCTIAHRDAKHTHSLSLELCGCLVFPILSSLAYLEAKCLYTIQRIQSTLSLLCYLSHPQQGS